MVNDYLTETTSMPGRRPGATAAAAQAVAQAARRTYLRAMNGPRKDIDPTTELVEEDEDQPLPEPEQDAFAELAPGAGSLAAGRAAIARHARLAPTSPGVYRMVDAKGDVLYVGKANSIRKRVVAYTRPTGYDPRIERMIAATASLEFVSTATETEALLLEANLIKRLRPRFNVLLRDDKSFPYILITADHWAPQILKHRGARKREGRYYGPFASVWAVNRTITALQPALLLRRLFRVPHAAVPAPSDQALLRPLHPRDRVRRIRRARARGERLPVGQEPGREERARRRDGEGLRRARLRARRHLPRPPRRPRGGAVAPGRQSPRRRGSRRVRRAPGGRLQLHRGVLLPHRPELGQPRLFPEGRPLARRRRGAGRVPRPILRRQAVPALRPDLARDRGARAPGGGLEHEEREQDRGQRPPARREEGSGRSRPRQRARGPGAPARRQLVPAPAAAIARRSFRVAAAAAAHRGLRQQPHPGQQCSRRHDRRRPGRISEKSIPQVQHPLRRSRARRRLRHDARGHAPSFQAADRRGAAPGADPSCGAAAAGAGRRADRSRRQIGRASCRERV